jgi:hypothetical protein
LATSETGGGRGSRPAFVPARVCRRRRSRGCLCPEGATFDGSVWREIVAASLREGHCACGRRDDCSVTKEGVRRRQPRAVAARPHGKRFWKRSTLLLSLREQASRLARDRHSGTSSVAVVAVAEDTRSNRSQRSGLLERLASIPGQRCASADELDDIVWRSSGGRVGCRSGLRRGAGPGCGGRRAAPPGRCGAGDGSDRAPAGAPSPRPPRTVPRSRARP